MSPPPDFAARSLEVHATQCAMARGNWCTNHTQFLARFDRNVKLIEGDSKITHVCQDGQDDVKEEYCHRSGLEFEARIAADDHVWQ